jgi:hypothetical protein
MTRNHRTARRVATVSGIAAGALAVAALTGSPVARADNSTSFDPFGLLNSSNTDSIDPISLLDQASSNLTDANDVLNTVTVEFPDHPSLVEHQLSLQDTVLDFLDKSVTLQGSFLSSLPDDSFFGGLITGYLSSADLALNYATHAVLEYDQAFDTDTPLTGAALDHAFFNLAAADLFLVGAEFNAIGPDIVAGLLGGADLTGDTGDVLAGGTADAAVDPLSLLGF